MSSDRRFAPSRRVGMDVVAPARVGVSLERMTPIGYLYKRVARRPHWIRAEQVDDIYSLSGCVSEVFADYIQYWRHNGYWLFDSPHVMEDLARENGIPLGDLQLFFYEVYELEYNDSDKQWQSFVPEASFGTNVEAPRKRRLEGFDVTTYSVHTSPECSPLSCNSLAETIRTNRHCLFETFDEARKAIEAGLFDNSEPGPFRITAVYSVRPDGDDAMRPDSSSETDLQ